ncbi:MAG: hypothetical protein QNJ47_21375 [Nostocaceae cyanobacterium]|nr:hypothetical protein [Nostocaceae cyanobacterium]
MSIFKKIGMKIMEIIRYVGKAITRIFGPTDDEYPPTGVQPFTGEPPEKKKRKRFSW